MIQTRRRTNPKDEFLEILRRHLNKADPEKQTIQDILHDSVADYIYHLMGKGNIPQQLLSTLEEDLKEEGLEIYRKITYGSLSLQDYVEREKTRLKKRPAS